MVHLDLKQTSYQKSKVCALLALYKSVIVIFALLSLPSLMGFGVMQSITLNILLMLLCHWAVLSDRSPVCHCFTHSVG